MSYFWPSDVLRLTCNAPGRYLNPLITFPAIFLVVGLGFTLTVAMGGVHRGELPVSGDDLSEFIGETVAPMDVTSYN